MKSKKGKPNQANQTKQTKPSKPNQPNQTNQSKNKPKTKQKPNLTNQECILAPTPLIRGDSFRVSRLFAPRFYGIEVRLLPARPTFRTQVKDSLFAGVAGYLTHISWFFPIEFFFGACLLRPTFSFHETTRPSTRMLSIGKSLEKLAPHQSEKWVRAIDYEYLEREYNIHKYYPCMIRNCDVSTPELVQELSTKPIYDRVNRGVRVKAKADAAEATKSRAKSGSQAAAKTATDSKAAPKSSGARIVHPAAKSSADPQPGAGAPRASARAVAPVAPLPRTSISTRLKGMIKPRLNSLQRTRLFDQTQATMTSDRGRSHETARRLSLPTSTYFFEHKRRMRGEERTGERGEQ